MERPRPDPSKILVQRLEPANLRIQLRLAENLVSGLDEFEREWNKFVEAMKEIITRCEQEDLYLYHLQLDRLLRDVEAIRLDLASRQHIVLPDYRDPLAKFVRTSVRTPSDALWSLIGLSQILADGRVIVPMDDEGHQVYNVSLKNFEINVDEARGEIGRRRRTLNEEVSRLKIMIEESERAQAEAHQLELRSVRSVKVMPLIWARFKESPVGNVVWWLGEDPLKKLLVALFAAGAVALVKWLVSR